MKKRQKEQEKIENLRRQSSPSINDQSDVGYLESLNILDLIHELKSSQVGLQLQNDEIRHLQLSISDIQQEVKQLYDYAPCGYIRLDENGMITNANLMALKLLKIKRKVLLHSAFSRFITAEWQSSYQATLQKALETSKKQRVELQLQHNAHTPVSVLLEIEAYAEDADGLHHFRLVLIDITKQKQAEKDLRTSEKKYRAIFDHSPVGLNIFTMEGQIIDTNEASCTMLGYTKDEILALNPEDLFNQDFIPRFNDFLQTVEEGKYFHAFTDNIKKDGTGFPVEIIGIKFSLNGEQCFLGITQDISEVERVKEELEKSHEKFQSLFRQLPVAVLLVEMDGTILDYNNETAITGVPREDLLGKNFSSLNLSCEDKLGKIFNNVLHGNTTPFECEARQASGKTRLLEIHPEIITYDGSKKLLFTLLDITKRKEAQQIIDKKTSQLQGLTKHLQSAREEEKAYIAREIHDELGQVLSALNMNLSSMEQEISNVEKQINRQQILADLNESKEIIKEAINGITKMITELRPPELDLLGLIPAIKRQINEFEKTGELEAEFISEIDELELDEAYNIALFRIVQEALTNVSKHAKATRVKVVIGKTDSKLHLSIVDDGDGFDSNRREQKKSFGLLGMEERVMLLNGNIEINSDIGNGTEISINMPLPG